ncbi:Uncharacterised protein [Weissella viridescens]|uniref:Uncharacterized protein n=1 Tax=Weissella viridescens TaxID=1629 RepID=A0A380NZB2_WEIVI|nr:Uncharacterised protein [Weissella viridescens]
MKEETSGKKARAEAEKSEVKVKGKSNRRHFEVRERKMTNQMRKETSHNDTLSNIFD